MRELAGVLQRDEIAPSSFLPLILGTAHPSHHRVDGGGGGDGAGGRLVVVDDRSKMPELGGWA